MKIRVLSRKSDLAIIQAREFSNYLQSKHPFVEIEFLTRSTSGDKDLKTPLSEMPTEGVFRSLSPEVLLVKNSISTKECLDCK